MLETPYIDAVLTRNGNETRQVRFEKGLRAVEEGIANKQMYNPDFTQAKDAIRYALDDVFRTLHEEILTGHHGGTFQNMIDYNYWDFNSSFDSVSMPKQLRDLKKKFNKWAPGKPTEPHQAGLNLIYRYMDVLNEAVQVAQLFKDVKPFIVKGRKPAVLTDAQRAQQEADLKNTGICPICAKRQKLDFNGRMVQHGYTLQRGWGMRNGMCYGFGHKAWELSPEGAEAYIKAMENHVETLNKRIPELQQSKDEVMTEMVEVRIGRGEYKKELKKYERGTPDYDRLRRNLIRKFEQELRFLDSDIKMYAERVKNWKPEPLKYGGAETQPRFQNRLLSAKR